MDKLAIAGEAEMRVLCPEDSFAWKIDVGWTFDFGLTWNFSRILHGDLNDRRVVFVLSFWGVGEIKRSFGPVAMALFSVSVAVASEEQEKWCRDKDGKHSSCR